MEVAGIAKLEFFHGKQNEDPFQWVESFELFVEVNEVPADRVIRFVKHAMRGDAYTWFKACESTWIECKETFIERFGVDEETLIYKLDTCAQGDETVRNYADRFRKLLSYLQTPLPPRMVTTMFIKGLEPNLRERINMTFPGSAPTPAGYY
jgi:Retrotransposon gag protein